MFEHKVAEKVEEDQQLLDFVELYTRFVEDSKKPNDTPQDRFRMRQFASQVDKAWRDIPADKQIILSEALIIKKLLPEEVVKLIRTFKAKVVKVS